MALKDILVYAEANAGGDARLGLAVEFARYHACRLTVLYVKQRTAEQVARRNIGEIGLVPAQELLRLDRSIEAVNEAAAERVRARVEALRTQGTLECEWRCVTGVPALVVAEHARTADLCVVGQQAGDDVAPGITFAEGMVFATGRPVLFVPAKGIFTSTGRNIAIAWNGSRPAARAVSDAMPLLQRAEQVTILSVDPGRFLNRSGSHSEAAMLEHLLRHGVRAAARRIDNQDRPVCAVLLDASLAIGADLLVAGAYGHPRLWERLLGGVTRDLLETMTLPVMMSH